MKVIQINSVCGYGSTGTIAVDLSLALNVNGIENWIMYGVGRSNHENAINFGSFINTKTHVLFTRLLGKHGFYSINATNKLVRILKRFNPDIIHLHNIHGHYLNVGILFKYLKSIQARTKVIWTLHDCWSFTGHCAHYDYIQCKKWESECDRCPGLRNYPISLVFDRSKESFNDKKLLFNSIDNLCIVTPSKWLEGEVKRSFLQNHRIEVINNGVNTKVFMPKEKGFLNKYGTKGRFVILGVSSPWTQRKGFSYFIELSNRIDDSMIIVLVGVSNMQKKLLPKNIIGIERTSSAEELASIYSSADVFVNLTLEDTFPTTNIESLACGTPVITFNTGGSPESVDTFTGFVVEKGDIDSIIRDIKIVKKVGKDKYSTNCLKRARAFYDKSLSTDKYIKLYKTIASAR